MLLINAYKIRLTFTCNKSENYCTSLFPAEITALSPFYFISFFEFRCDIARLLAGVSPLTGFCWMKWMIIYVIWLYWVNPPCVTWQGHLTSMRSVQCRLPLSHNATDWWTAHIFKTTWTWIMGRKGEFALFFTITTITSFVFRFLWVNRSIDMQFILCNIVCLFYWLIELKINHSSGFWMVFSPTS